jgi:hypothetical protein
MRAFTFEFKGVALGGTAVVIAKNYESALSQLSHETNVECLDVKGAVLSKEGVVYYWNGDY